MGHRYRSSSAPKDRQYQDLPSLVSYHQTLSRALSKARHHRYVLPNPYLQILLRLELTVM